MASIALCFRNNKSQHLTSQQHLAILHQCLVNRLLAASTKHSYVLRLVIYAGILFVCAINYILQLIPDFSPDLRNNNAFDPRYGASTSLLNIIGLLLLIEGLLCIASNVLNHCTQHPYLSTWIRPFQAVSGDGKYAHLAAKLTNVQYDSLRRLLKILCIHDRIIPYFSAGIFTCYILQRVLTQDFNRPDLLLFAYLLTAFSLFIVNRVSVCTPYYYIYLVQYYTYLLRNAITTLCPYQDKLRSTYHERNAEHKVLSATEHTSAAANGNIAQYSTATVVETMCDFVRYCKQLYEHNAYWKYLHSIRFFTCTVVNICLLYLLSYSSIPLILYIALLTFLLSTFISISIGFLLAHKTNEEVAAVSKKLGSFLSYRYPLAAKCRILITVEATYDYESASICDIYLSHHFLYEYLVEFFLNFLLLVSYVRML